MKSHGDNHRNFLSPEIKKPTIASGPNLFSNAC
jgi:hypothetical protein